MFLREHIGGSPWWLAPRAVVSLLPTPSPIARQFPPARSLTLDPLQDVFQALGQGERQRLEREETSQTDRLEITLHPRCAQRALVQVPLELALLLVGQFTGGVGGQQGVDPAAIPHNAPPPKRGRRAFWTKGLACCVWRLPVGPVARCADAVDQDSGRRIVEPHNPQ